tara:strand:- start:1043 stop:1486 length:444 start_codon:yes stop_codon:yes gene_type:complete
MTLTDPSPIHQTMASWLAHLAGGAPTPLEDLLHPDVVFWSPVIFAPQRGRDLTLIYLTAASQVFPGDPETEGSEPSGPSGGGFHYTKTVLDGNHAVLEFETTMGGIQVNGVDIITCDDNGLIIEFKVMIRPFKAIEAVRDRMAAMLA